MLLVVPDYRLWFNCPQLGILSCAASVRAAGGKVELVDAVADGNYMSDLDAKIRAHDVVGITANVSQAYSGREIARHIRRRHPEKKIVWGGPYPSAEYARLVPELADAVVIGEGETQIAEIAKGSPFESIPSLAFWSGGKLRVNERRGYIEDLDALPLPAWDLVDVTRYNFPGLSPGALMQTQRGCPFNCINCTTFIHGNKYRQRSAQSAVSEIEWLVKDFHVREIHFWDDNFTLNTERVKRLCEEIIRRDLKVRMTLPNGIRADISDREMFRLMKRAGFYYVNVAVESGDQDVIAEIGKKLDLAKVAETVGTLREIGFRVGLLFMMGMPFDTPKSLERTVEFAAELPAHHAHFFVVTPFPGTKLYEMASKGGDLRRKYEEEHINFDDQRDRFVNMNMSSEELWRWHSLAYRKFYTPRRILSILSKMIEEGSVVADLNFLLKCGINIFFSGHR